MGQKQDKEKVEEYVVTWSSRGEYPEVTAPVSTTSFPDIPGKCPIPISQNWHPQLWQNREHKIKLPNLQL